MFKFIKALGGRQSPQRKARAAASGHYLNGKFQNLIPTRTIEAKKIPDLLHDQFTGKQQRVPKHPIPTVQRIKKDFENPPADQIRITWLGHASTLIEMDGFKILTDPVWSKRVSPFESMGPKRFFEVPLSLSDLPDVQAVVISHDHYDHLDMDTIIALAKRELKFVVPLSVGAHLEAWGVSADKIIELNWHENIQFGDLKITVTPARHFSGRSLTDRNHTLWASFVIETPQFKVFYSGDTGPLDNFAEVGNRYGPFDISLMQIGACSRNWPEIHMSPKEGVEAHIQVKAKLMIPVHWGTFNLATHAWNDPAHELIEAAQVKGVKFRIPKPGQFVLSGDSSETIDRWWEKT